MASRGFIRWSFSLSLFLILNLAPIQAAEPRVKVALEGNEVLQV